MKIIKPKFAEKYDSKNSISLFYINMSNYTRYKIPVHLARMWWKPLRYNGLHVSFFDDEKVEIGGTVSFEGMKIALCISTEQDEVVVNNSYNMAIGVIDYSYKITHIFETVERSLLASGIITYGAVSCKIIFKVVGGNAEDIIYHIISIIEGDEKYANITGGWDNKKINYIIRNDNIINLILKCHIEISFGFCLDGDYGGKSQYISINYSEKYLGYQRKLIARVEEYLVDVGCRPIQFLENDNSIK